MNMIQPGFKLYYYDGEILHIGETSSDSDSKSTNEYKWWKEWWQFHYEKLEISKYSKYGVNIIFVEAINRNLYKELDKIGFTFDPKAYSPYPTIFLGVDEFDIQTPRNVCENKPHSPLYGKMDIILGIPRSFRFLDSSIWCRYLSIMDDNFAENLISILDFIQDNQVLYLKYVTKEYIELQYRLLKESRIKDLRGHGSLVAPLVFHSELAMKRLREKKNFKEKCRKYKWRFLLIDDYAYKELRPKENEGTAKYSKSEIIKRLLEDLGFSVDIIIPGSPTTAHNCDIEIYCTKEDDCLASAKELIKTHTFDIILLDYLLGKLDNNTREYGSQLFERIENDPEIKEHSGPMNKFWIFNTSSFYSAMDERIIEQGHSSHTENWYFNQGGDPINTPELFKYSLLYFLYYQIEEVTNFSSFRMKENRDDNNDLIKMIIKKIFCGDPKKTKLYALRNYPYLYEIKARFELLQQKENSLLIKSYFDQSIVKPFMKKEDYKRYFQRFWSHLLSLIQMIAHGSGLQYREMWKEYSALCSLLEDIKKDQDAEDGEEEMKILKDIEEFIVSLSKVY